LKAVEMAEKRFRQSGFTIVELLVAATITSTALLGVYAMFQHALEIEADAGRAMRDNAAAVALVNTISESLRRAVNVTGHPAIRCSKTGQADEMVLQCFTGPDAIRSEGLQRAAICRHRYRWNFDPQGPRGGLVERRTWHYAGTENITGRPNTEEGDEELLWLKTPPIVVGRRIERLSVRFKPASRFADPTQKWLGRWSGAAGDLIVRVEAHVGGETAEVLVRTVSNGGVGEAEEG